MAFTDNFGASSRAFGAAHARDDGTGASSDGKVGVWLA